MLDDIVRPPLQPTPRVNNDVIRARTNHEMTGDEANPSDKQTVQTQTSKPGRAPSHVPGHEHPLPLLPITLAIVIVSCLIGVAILAELNY